MPKEREVSKVEIRDWSGLVTHSDRQDIAPGAGRLQVNLQSDRPGSLRVRRGLTLVQFDARGLVELSDIVSVQESLSVTVVTLANLLAETVTVAESVFLTFAANVVTDTVTVSEAIEANLVIRFASVADNVTISESVVVLKTMFRSVSDTVTVSELIKSRFNDTSFAGSTGNKHFLVSGTFSTTVLSSASNYADSLAFDGTNSPLTQSEFTPSSKLVLQSGRFSSTIKTSLSVSGVDTEVTGISSKVGPHTPWIGRTDKKLYFQSGQFSSTLRTSQSVGAVQTTPMAISWDGTNTPWTGLSQDKLYLTSGQFSSTIKTSLSVTSIETSCTGVSFDSGNTPWTGRISEKLFMTSGQFSGTLKTSLSVTSLATEPTGIDTTLRNDH